MTASNYASHETIKYVLAVMSGKGGVGRSLVTCLLAIALRSHKLRVGILDADLTGPSIAHMFGIESHLSLSDNGKVEPLVSSGGIKVMSMNMFLEDETAPLGWYGPMIASTLRQFYKDAEWGDLDYLLVDLPAGTSDGAMTVLESFSLDGVVLVTSPQALTTVMARKCINIIHQFNGVIVGIIENMTYVEMPNNERFEVFGLGDSSDLTAEAGAPLLARLPLDHKLAVLCDTGRIEEYYAEVCDRLAATLVKTLTMKHQY